MNAEFDLREVSVANFTTKLIKADPFAKGEIIDKLLLVAEVIDGSREGRLLHADLWIHSCRFSVQCLTARLLLLGFIDLHPGRLRHELFVVRNLPCRKKQISLISQWFLIESNEVK